MEPDNKTKKSPPEFSVVITCYYEEQSIEEFYERLSKAMESLGRTYEIIFVNDGSADRTFEKLEEIFKKDPNVSTVIDLFKNSGQGYAMSAGISFARGDYFIFLDSDLQLDPEDLPLLVKEIDNGYDAVSGCRKNRKESLLRIIPSRIANMIMRKVSNSNFKDFGCNIKIFNGALVRACGFGPFKRFSSVLVVRETESYKEIPVTHHERRYGKSGYTFKKLMVFNTENIVFLSETPFQILSIVGFAIALLVVFRIILSWFIPFSLLGEDITAGFLLNAILLSVAFLVGILSLTGEYVIRNFLRVQGNPGYIIKNILRKE